jgi:hypothetical protein
LRGVTLRATLIMVPLCAAWLRLLVTALFCVVGVVRPGVHRSEGPALRAPQPSEISAAHRESELLRLRERITPETHGDDASLVDVELHRPVLAGLSAGSHTSRDVRVHSAWQERSRARGPPIA